MQTYWLTDRTNGETKLVDGYTIERLLEVELGYVEWCIKEDGVFETGEWLVVGRSVKGGERSFAAGAK